MILHRMSMTMPGRGHEGRLYKDDVTDEERVAGSAWTVDKGIRQQTPPGGVLAAWLRWARAQLNLVPRHIVPQCRRMCIPTKRQRESKSATTLPQ